MAVNKAGYIDCSYYDNSLTVVWILQKLSAISPGKCNNLHSNANWKLRNHQLSKRRGDSYPPRALSSPGFDPFPSVQWNIQLIVQLMLPWLFSWLVILSLMYKPSPNATRLAGSICLRSACLLETPHSGEYNKPPSSFPLRYAWSKHLFRDCSYIWALSKWSRW